MKLFHLMCCYVGVELLGSTTPLKFRRAKTFKIWCDLRQLSTLTADISKMDEAINKQ